MAGRQGGESDFHFPPGAQRRRGGESAMLSRHPEPHAARIPQASTAYLPIGASKPRPPPPPISTLICSPRFHGGPQRTSAARREGRRAGFKRVFSAAMLIACVG